MPLFPYGVRIIGIGSYLPGHIRTNAEISNLVETDDEWIQSRTGIAERRIAKEGEETSDLAVQAANKALEDAGVRPHGIDLIIVATATPDMVFPSTACLVARAIGAPKAAAFDLSAACSGFVYSLVTAAGMMGPGGYRRALVIGAETLSRITDWTDRTTCILFGDAAGAVVLERCDEGHGLLAWELGSDSTGADLLSVPPPHRKIQQNGREVFKFAVVTVAESVTRVAEMAGLGVADIDWIVPHQANTRILDAASKRLNIPLERMYSNLRRVGNTSAASVPVALADMRREGLLESGQLVMFTGFGGGLTWASALFRW